MEQTIDYASTLYMMKWLAVLEIDSHPAEERTNQP
jgi:hypothetical protein